MNLIAFDVAPKLTGWAFVDARGNWQTGVIRLSDKRSVLDLLRDAKAAGCGGVVIETWPPLPNPNTRAMFRCQGELIALCEVRGFHWELMHVGTWRSLLGWPRMVTKDAKRFAIQEAVKFAKKEIVSNDEADAICMLEAWRRRYESGEQAEIEFKGPRGGKFAFKKASAK